MRKKDPWDNLSTLPEKTILLVSSLVDPSRGINLATVSDRSIAIFCDSANSFSQKLRSNKGSIENLKIAETGLVLGEFNINMSLYYAMLEVKSRSSVHAEFVFYLSRSALVLFDALDSWDIKYRIISIENIILPTTKFVY